MEPEKKDGVETGGGGAAGAQTPGAVAALTEEQVTQIVSARFKAFEGKFEKSLGDALGAFATKIKEQLLPALAPQPAKPEAKAPAHEKKDSPPDLKRLEDQISTLTRQAEEARAERDAERGKVRDATLRQRVLDALGAGGVEGVRARHAIGLLVDAEKRVRWAEDGESAVFRAHDGGEVDVDAGVRDWLKTEDGKFYLPARGVAGSGDRPGGAPPPARPPGAPPDRSTVAEGLRRALTGQLGG